MQASSQKHRQHLDFLTMSLIRSRCSHWIDGIISTLYACIIYVAQSPAVFSLLCGFSFPCGCFCVFRIKLLQSI